MMHSKKSGCALTTHECIYKHITGTTQEWFVVIETMNNFFRSQKDFVIKNLLLQKVLQ